MTSPTLKVKSLTHSHYQLDMIKLQVSRHKTSISSIDLIFCTNESGISNYGADVSIFGECHHNSVYTKTNMRVPLPPTYGQQVWDYEKANIENVKKAISIFDWNKTFENLSVDEKGDVLK